MKKITDSILNFGVISMERFSETEGIHCRKHETPCSTTVSVHLESLNIWSAWIFTSEGPFLIIAQSEMMFTELELPLGKALLYTVSSLNSSISSEKLEIFSFHKKLILKAGGTVLSQD